MDGLSQAVGRGLQNLSAQLGDLGAGIGPVVADTVGSVDLTVHQFVPWYIPLWLLAAVVVFIGGLFAFRR